MKKVFHITIILLLTTINVFAETKPATLMVRCDDIGMCHAVNVAAKELAETGIPLNYSIMFVCPWYQEAVDILKAYENVCFGIHLTMNSEWKNYRWGPCAVTANVSSLVDENGYFYPRKDLAYDADPSLGEIEIEIRAQIERALRSGLDIQYCDTHMSTLDTREDIHDIIVRLAVEYGLIFSEFVSDYRMGGMYSQEPKKKMEAIVDQLQNLDKEGVNLLVCHLGKTGPEMDAMIDMNPSGPTNMSEHREAEFKVLSSKAFRKQIVKNNINLSTYAKEYMAEKGK
ncbi:MAG: ChbG/HpnK family deacetylase [Candidatus Marinimicrobia bacterium]|nr:ChbG/HpnK family deacetylase [Candidatus Neomarinimicrobiota bacterium]